MNKKIDLMAENFVDDKNFFKKQLRKAAKGSEEAEEEGLHELKEECIDVCYYLRYLINPQKIKINISKLNKRMVEIDYKMSYNFLKWFKWRKNYYLEKLENGKTKKKN